MDRRQFIRSLAVAMALDPERLLWIPGQKTIFIPPPTPIFDLIEGKMLRAIQHVEMKVDMALFEREITAITGPRDLDSLNSLSDDYPKYSDFIWKGVPYG